MIKIEIDVAGIAQQFKDMALEVEQDLTKGVAKLAAMTHARILEDSQQELHTSRKKYAQAFDEVQEVSPGVFALTLNQSALWIEEGLPENFDMKPGLLKNSKTSGNGKKYKVIPFEHSKAPSEMSGYAQKVASRMKTQIEKRGVKFHKIEFNKNGSPRMGRLHEFDFKSEIPGKGNTPIMKGVNIFQSMRGGKVRRDVMTFRTVTDGPGSEGKFIHPGFTPKHYFEKATEWAVREWETAMLPEILKKWS
jgi:hypothetical protein